MKRRVGRNIGFSLKCYKPRLVHQLEANEGWCDATAVRNQLLNQSFILLTSLELVRALFMYTSPAFICVI